MRRRFGVVAAIGLLALAAAAAGLAQRSAKPPSPGLAQLLRERDPGKRLGGNTIVVVGNGVRIIGVPDRSAFIIALGGNDTSWLVAATTNSARSART